MSTVEAPSLHPTSATRACGQLLRHAVQSLRGDRRGGRVTMSCQVSDIDFSRQLTETGGDTRITVCVDIPPAEAHRFDDEREAIAASLTALARLAEAEALAA